MGLADRSYWWMACDKDRCCRTTEDAEQPEQAEDHARSLGWVEEPTLGWLCPEHAFSRSASCPGEDCPMCSGAACELCGAGLLQDPDRPTCEHDVIERHQRTIRGTTPCVEEARP